MVLNVLKTFHPSLLYLAENSDEIVEEASEEELMDAIVKKPLRGVGQPLIGVGQPLGGVGQRRAASNRCRAASCIL
ncbi:hypothetical protein TSUD_240910 [Trifolium subterraneum]|uniref:Uncharacterized protein n=1 Tax=Trifolium subterraneum TaxID=3900 RepID=A0A2Z6PGP5_TRISU|nr:hypothetical protein TSUD_240910 [Trifolium subterraneum]